MPEGSVAMADAPLVLAVDPRDRDAEPARRNDVVHEALRGVQPARTTEPRARRLEVRRRRLVSADLLRGDHELEVDGQVAPRAREQVVVHVREDGEPVPRVRQPPQGVVRVRERRPRRQALGQEALGARREPPAEPLGHPPRREREDLAVRPVALGFHDRLDRVVGGQHGRAVEPHTVGGGRGRDGVADPALPVDERAVAVERHDVVASHANAVPRSQSSSRPMTTRRISEVPPPGSRKRASRK